MSLSDWFDLTLGEIPIRWVALIYIAWWAARGITIAVLAGVTEYRRIMRDRRDASER